MQQFKTNQVETLQTPNLGTNQEEEQINDVQQVTMFIAFVGLRFIAVLCFKSNPLIAKESLVKLTLTRQGAH